MAKIISTDKARQGNRGTHVLIMLIVALVLVAIVWVGVELYGGAIAPDPAAQPAATQTQPG